jgi:hypothetical protein
MSDECICDIQEEKKKSKKVDVLKTSIYDKKTIKVSSIEPVYLPKDLKEKEKRTVSIGPIESIKSIESIKKPKGIVSKCENISPLKLDDLEVEKVFVEYRRKKSKNDMCNILRLAGFNPNWTKSDIKRLLETPDGTVLLSQINSEIQRLTGKDFISEEDIVMCLPNYLNR